MNHNIRKILTGCLLAAVLVFTAGCSAELTPYESNDADNYRVSVKYDANGGIFTTNTSVIVDSYNPAEVKDGKIALIAPDHDARGNDAFAAVKNGHFLAGWYAERTGSEEAGYTYSGKWDFENDLLELDPNGSYTASEPVLTLYAAWVPLFEVNFLDRQTGENLGSYTYDPTSGVEIKVPEWDTETGAIDMYKFPKRSGYTFEAAYYDEAGTKAVQTGSLEHTGSINLANGTAEGYSMNVYTDWMEGEWYHIYSVEQFLDNASVTGSYVLHTDLDFAGQIWPTSLMYGGFTGTIQGNGHTLRNIELTQTNNSKNNAGLFGRLAETAVLSDVAFENVTFTIQGGTRVAGTSYGLLAGAVADTAKLTNVSVTNSLLQVSTNAYFGTEDYVIGLVCGIGSTDIDHSGIACGVTGDPSAALYAYANAEGQVTLTDTPVETEPAEESEDAEETVPENADQAPA